TRIRTRSHRCIGERYSRSESLGRLVNWIRGFGWVDGVFDIGTLSLARRWAAVSAHYEASTEEDEGLEPQVGRGRSSNGVESAIVVFVLTPPFSRSRRIRSSRSP